MADLQNEINSLMGRKSLDPLQQTVFEKGPQSSFTPPEVQNVYQEARTIFPNPNAVGIEQPIDWYGLGQNAFDIAQKTFGNVLDYLVTTKANGVRDLKDQTQSQLYNLETQLSTEEYNATQEKRNKSVSLVDQLNSEATRIKNEYKEKLKNVLTDDHDMIMNPDLDMSTLGLKYQELALTARNSDRDIERTTNRMIYQLERVNKQRTRSNFLADAWKISGGARQQDNMPLVYSGLAPIPTDESGTPMAFVEPTQDGNGWKPKTTMFGGQEIPAIIQGPDGKYYFNPSAIDAGNNEDIQKLFHYDQNMTSGSYALSASSNQFTKAYEEIAQAVAKSSTANVGASALIGTALANVPDTVANNIVNSIPDLDASEKMRLMLYREHMREGLPMQDLQKISGTTKDSLQRASDSVRKIAGSNTGFIAGNIGNTFERDSLNETAQIAEQVLTTLGGNVPKDSFKFTEGSVGSGGWTSTGQLSHILQKNPGLQPILTRVMATVYQNEGLWKNAPKPEEAKAALVTKLLSEQINASGWTHVDNTIDGTPAFIYNPGLVDYNRVLSQYKPDEKNTKIATWNDHDKHMWMTPETRNQAVAKTVFMSNQYGTMNPKAQDVDLGSALVAAKSMVSDLDEDAFKAVWLGSQPTTTEEGYNTKRIASSNTTADLTRIAIACSRAVMLKHSPTITPESTLDSKLPAIKKTLDDLPNYSDKREGFMPWLGADLDTGAENFAYMAQVSGGGLPVALTAVTGESGINYMKIIAPEGAISAGRFTPRNTDGRPTLMIPSVYRDREGNVINDKEFQRNMDRLSSGFNRAYNPSIARVNDIPGLPLTKENAQNVIAYTDRPYVTKKFKQVFANVLVDAPLKSAEDSITFLRQNGKALEDVVDADPILKNVKKFLYEFTDVPNSGQTNADDRILFSDKNLEVLYRQALNNGAKTNADFVGFVLGAMHNAYNNSEVLTKRDFAVQKMYRASNTDDTVKGPFQKGRILWKENTDSFVDTVVNNVKSGSVIMKGPALEDPAKTAYFVVDPNNVPPTLQRDGYTIAMDATMLPKFETTYLGKAFKVREQSKKVQSYLYPPSIDNLNYDALSFLGRQSTLPSELTGKFQKDFQKFIESRDLFDYPDIPFVDWAKYYADNNKFPDSMEKIDAKYILPGHTSTLRWVDRRERPDSFGRTNELSGNVKAGVKATQAGTFTDEELAQAEQQLQFPVYVPGKIWNAAVNLASYPLGALFGFAKTVDDSLSRGFSQTQANFDERAMAGYRQRVLDEYNANPMAWYTKVFGSDELHTLRQHLPSTTEVKVPEKVFDMVHYIVHAKPDFEESFGLSKETVKKLESTGLSPAEMELQIRLNLQNTSDYMADIKQAVDKISPDEFKLDRNLSDEFCQLLYFASQDSNNKLTPQQANDIAMNPKWGLDLKKAFFSIKMAGPDGYIAKTRMTTGDSIKATFKEMLDEKPAFEKDTADLPVRVIDGFPFEPTTKETPRSFYEDVYGKDQAKELIDQVQKRQAEFGSQEVSETGAPPNYSTMDKPVQIYRQVGKLKLNVWGFVTRNKETREPELFISFRTTQKNGKEALTKIHEGTHVLQYREIDSTSKPSKIFGSSLNKDEQYVLDPREISAHLAAFKAEYYTETKQIVKPYASDAVYGKFYDWLGNKGKDSVFAKVLHEALTSPDERIRKVMQEISRQVAMNDSYNNDTRMT